MEEKNVKIKTEDGETVFYLSGELDHYGVSRLRLDTDEYLTLNKPKKVVLNLSKIGFSDSAGLGFVLGRFTKVREYGGSFMLENVPPEFMKILRLAAADKFIKIREVKNKENENENYCNQQNEA